VPIDEIGHITIEALIDGETAYPGEFLYTNKEREDWKDTSSTSTRARATTSTPLADS